MRSGKFFFNKTVFWKNVTRFSPIWIIYLAFWIVTVPLTAATGNGARTPAVADMFKAVQLAGGIFGVLVTFSASLASAMAVFSYLFWPKSANMAASLPIKREGYFLTSYLSGLFWLIGSNAVTAVLMFIVQICTGDTFISGILVWFAITSLMVFFAYSFAALCAALTGHILVLPAIFVIFNCLAAVVESLVRALISQIVYGMGAGSEPVLMPLSPPVWLARMSVFLTDTCSGTEYYSGWDSSVMSGAGCLKISYGGWAILGIYAAAAVIMVLGAMALIKRRQVETASDVVAVKCLKPVFKYCMTFGCALVIGLALFYIAFGETGRNNFIPLTVLTLIGAFVGYFLAKILINKSFRVFSGWTGLIVSMAVIAAAMCACEFDATGYQTRVPDAAEVNSVEVCCSADDIVFSQPESIQAAEEIHKSIIADKAMYESRTVSGDGSEYYGKVEIIYNLKNGKTMTREYSIIFSSDQCQTEGSDAWKLSELMNSREAVVQRCTLDVPVTDNTVMNAYVSWYNGESNVQTQLSGTQAAELYSACILPDAMDGTIGTTEAYCDSDSGKYYDAYIEIDVSAFDEKSGTAGDGDNLYIALTKDAVRTNEYLASLGISPHSGDGSDIMS